MAKAAYLALEDGAVFHGEAFGAEAPGHGEVVFSTNMTGYQEALTDPSYAGQIVVLTYPLVGNYGINLRDYESECVQVAGFVVRELCDYPSHGLSTSTLHEFLASQGIPGIKGVDTRSITRRLRTQGVMMGLISSGPTQDGAPTPVAASSSSGDAEAALAGLKALPRYGEVDFVKRVTASERYDWPESSDASLSSQASDRRILVMDLGVKYNILRLLHSRGFHVTAVPAATSAEDMLTMNPSGIVLSPGPGDPALLEYAVDTARRLVGRVPLMGICLGHQIIARALGCTTFKLKFGHRGANHPVKEVASGRVYITAQNHGYTVDADSLPAELEVTHVNLNDGTVEGLRHRDLPLLTIQYHSEASPGPLDNEYIFDSFLEMALDCPQLDYSTPKS